MTDQTRRVTIDAPDGPTILAARHLDATEGPVQVGATVTTATRSAIDRVLGYVAKAHNSPATGEREPATEYAAIKFTRHQGQAITVNEAPPKARLDIRVLADRYAYLHMPDAQTIVFADQVVYRITGYQDGALELELVEDWRTPATVLVEEKPLSDEDAKALKTKWKQEHGNSNIVTTVAPKEET